MRGRTRRELLTDGARIAMAGAAVSVLEPAAARAATEATPPETESDRLIRLLRLELLLLFACQHILGSSLLYPRAAQTVATLQSHAEAHIAALRARLSVVGGVAPSPPASVAAADRHLAHRRIPERLGQLHGAGDALRLLLDVERVTVGAYFVALIKLEDPALIRLAAEIMANGAQHEVTITRLLDHDDVQQAVPNGLVQGSQ